MIRKSCSRGRQDLGTYRHATQTLASSATKMVLPSALALGSITILLVATSPCRACFSIVVGKGASGDGCVLVAHNEDDTPPQIVNHYKVPRCTHSPGEMVVLRNGGKLEQVPETWSYLWSEMPGMQFSDSYVNEWGVCITSDNCPSREDQGKLTDGGIGYMLRRLVAERARSAREGVRIAGEMVERFGYVASGRTYIIADPEEGWLFCAIHGKHWLARRVGDDEVAIVANTFTVREVDLSDVENVLASKDIVTYATRRGWYDPNKHGAFDFAAVYADPKSSANPLNYGRQSIGLHYVAVNPLAIRNRLPFSVVPSEKLGVADLIRILRYNGSSNSIRTVDGQQVTCNAAEAICRGSTQTSFVARLATQPSRDLGIIYWVCLSAPETSVFVPFPFGISRFPAGYRAETKQPTPEVFERKVTSPFRADAAEAFWTFSNFRDKTQNMPAAEKARITNREEAIEAKAMETIRSATESLPAASSRVTKRLLQALPSEIYLSALMMMAESQASHVPQ